MSDRNILVILNSIFFNYRNVFEPFSMIYLPGRGDHLSASAMNWFIGDASIQNLKLAISDRFFTQGTFSCSPLKPLHYGVLDRTKQALVYLSREGIVYQDVGA